MNHDQTTTAIGTATGTVMSLVYTIKQDDVIQTIVLSALGAVVGFTVTVTLKWLRKKIVK